MRLRPRLRRVARLAAIARGGTLCPTEMRQKPTRGPGAAETYLPGRSHTQSGFGIPMDFGGVVRLALEGFLGLRSASMLWADGQTRCAELVTAWLLRDAGFAALPLLVLPGRRGEMANRFETVRRGGPPRHADGPGEGSAGRNIGRGRARGGARAAAFAEFRRRQ
ncbi:unnamed protein product, partial [Amoebophrya sp. A120]|eukprot:GSA120T00009808001.1